MCGEGQTCASYFQDAPDRGRRLRSSSSGAGVAGQDEPTQTAAFACFCESPRNVWSVGAPAICTDDACDSEQACGGATRASHVKLGFTREMLPQCYCDCAPGYDGDACELVEDEELSVLYIEPVAFLLISLVLCAAFATFLVRKFDPKDDVTFTTDCSQISEIQMAEGADAVLDLVIWWVTWASGDFEYSNDPDNLLAWAAGLVACFSTVQRLPRVHAPRVLPFPPSLRPGG